MAKQETLTEKQALLIHQYLQDNFENIDARMSVIRTPDYQQNIFVVTGQVSIFHDNTCVLVVTSETQFKGFLSVVRSYVATIETYEDTDNPFEKGGE